MQLLNRLSVTDICLMTEKVEFLWNKTESGLLVRKALGTVIFTALTHLQTDCMLPDEDVCSSSVKEQVIVTLSNFECISSSQLEAILTVCVCVFVCSDWALDTRNHLCHLQNCRLHVGKNTQAQHRKVRRLGETDEITAACRAHTCTERVWMNDSPFRGNMSVWEINGRWLVNDTMGNMIHYCLPLRHLPQQTHTDQHISAPTSWTTSFPHLTLSIFRVRPKNRTFTQTGGRPFAIGRSIRSCVHAM